MSPLREQLDEVAGKIGTAYREVEADDGASPVLVAVVREFEAKATKARKAVVGADAGAREAIVELEQAGDSAKAAAEADPAVGGSARQAVLDAHLAICMLKASM
jgi:predicted lipoprotein